MNDELPTRTDTRGRAAGTALQRAAMVHAWNAPAPERPTVWLRPALVMAAVVAVIAGLVWVSGRQAEPADQRDPADLRYVIGDLPEGWKATEARDESTVLRPNEFGITMATYGTRDDPMAPYVQIIWQDPAKDDGLLITGLPNMAGYSNLREVAVRDGVAACGDDQQTVRCAMDSLDGQLQVNAIGLADDRIAQLFSAVQVVDGEPFIELASLPAGLSPLFHGDPYEQISVVWSRVMGDGPAIVNYSHAASDSGASLIIGWADENDMASAAGFGELAAVKVNGNGGYIGLVPYSGLREIVWRDGDRTFALATDDPAVDLVALAESVRPATNAEWSAIDVEVPNEPAVGGTDGTVVAGTVPETVPGEVPATTDPSVSMPDAVVGDVAVTQVVEPVNAATVLYSCTSPEGESGQVQVAILAGSILVSDATGGGSTLLPLDGTVYSKPVLVGVNGGVGAVAVSTDPRAAQLRVTRSNGERWVLDLVVVQGHPELKVGVIVLAEDQLVTYDVVDADGNVLASGPELG